MKRILVLMLLLNSVAFASDSDVLIGATLKSSCNYNVSNNSYFDRGYLEEKEYEVIFKNPYIAFENYDLLSAHSVKFVTDLYTISPTRARADNKSVAHIFLSEKDIKNIFKSSSVEIVFDSELFNNNYGLFTKREIRMPLNNDNLRPHLRQCDRDYRKYLLAYKKKENVKLFIKISMSLVGLALLIMIVKLLIKFVKKTAAKAVTKAGELKKGKRQEKIKTLIEDETIKGTIKKSFSFSEKSNINELQEAISDALKRNDILEAQKLMDILKRITDD